MIIREAVPEDYPVLADLWFDSWMSVGISNETDLTREAVRTRFYEEVKTRWRLFVAAENGLLHGLMALVPSESRIDQLFVAPTSKGSGIGWRLMAHAKLELSDGIVLVTHTENARARAFYERQGFLLERTEDDPVHRRQKCHYVWRPGRLQAAGLIIREATEEDFDAVARVWKESWISIGNNNEIDDAVTMADLRARIPDRIAGGWSLFVAECEGRIDAMLAIERAINHLDQVFVAPSAQGRGLGSALLAHARALMPEQIWLSTAANNTRARDWYEREGFVLEKIEHNPKFGRDVAYYRWRAAG